MKFLSELLELTEAKVEKAAADYPYERGTGGSDGKTVHIFKYSGFWHYEDPKTGDYETVDGNTRAGVIRRARLKYGPNVKIVDITTKDLNEAATAEKFDDLVELLKKTPGVSKLHADNHNEGDEVNFKYQSDAFTATLRQNNTWDVMIRDATGNGLPVGYKLKNATAVLAAIKEWLKNNDID